LQRQDVGVGRSGARGAGVVGRLGSAVARLSAARVARGDGDLDHSGLVKLVTELSGRS
jgi:2-hydroxy-3-oxopropionate reductase